MMIILTMQKLRSLITKYSVDLQSRSCLGFEHTTLKLPENILTSELLTFKIFHGDLPTKIIGM